MADADPSVQTPSTTDAPAASQPSDTGAPADAPQNASAPADAAPTKTLLTSGDETKSEAEKTEPAKDAKEAKEGEEPADAPKAPEKYEVTLKAEGQTLDAEAVSALTPVLQKHGISNEAFNEIANAYAEYAQKANTAAQAKADADFATWLQGEVTANVAAIKQEWGPQFEPNLAIAQRAVGRFGDAAMKKILDETGLGSHPSFIKAFHAIGRMITEDQPPQNTTPVGRKSDAEVFYSGTH